MWEPRLPEEQGQQQCLPTQQFLNLLVWQLMKLEFLLALPFQHTHIPSHFHRKAPAPFRGLPAAWLATACSLLLLP